MKTWLRLGLLAGVGASAVGAVDWKALRPQGYVSDFAGVIASPTRARLEAYCDAVEHATGAQIDLVTVPSLQGEHITEVVKTLYDGWNVGRGAAAAACFCSWPSVIAALASPWTVAAFRYVIVICHTQAGPGGATSGHRIP